MAMLFFCGCLSGSGRRQSSRPATLPARPVATRCRRPPAATPPPPSSVVADVNADAPPAVNADALPAVHWGSRHVSVWLLRFTVSAVLLVVVFANIPTSELADAWPDSLGTAAAWLIAAVAVTGAAFVMAAVRWWEVAHTLGLRCSLRRMLSDHLAGQFVSSFLPTTIGGDVLRVNRLGRSAGDHYRAFASVVIERLTGWIVLPLLTLTALALDPGLVSSSVGWALVGGALGTLAVLAVVLWVAEHPRGLGRIAGGTVVRDALGAVHVGLSVYRRRPRATVRLLVVGLAYQSLLVLAAGFAAAAVGVRPGAAAMLAFVPLVLAVQVLPISIGGLGVREAALVFLLASQDVPDGEAALLGLVLYALTLLVSLAGAPSLAVGGHGRRSRARAAAAYFEQGL
ncbi:MAG TPA: hypothetical protein DEP69_00400 [Acidimicrobiaceae bacterium]|nr:hypothetical protein [Acidimicrobiaceae bacterium]